MIATLQPGTKRRLIKLVCAGILLTAAAAAVGLTVYQAKVYATARQGTYNVVGSISPASALLSTLRAADGNAPLFGQDAVLLVYNTHCSACNQNMANWMTLIAALQRTSPGAVVAAVSVEADSLQREYWDAMLPDAVRLYTLIDADDFIARVGTRLVPSTIVIRNGQVDQVYAGFLGPLRQARVLASLQ